MKNSTLLISFLFCLMLTTASSQIVTENILFDNYTSPTNNDFESYFSVGIGLSQVATDGITGGCIVTPTTFSWGNNNAIYCSKYIASALDYSKTSICFKYDTTQINSSSTERAVSIFLRPSSHFLHHIIVSVNLNKGLQIITNSWNNVPPILNLVNDHWYELILQTDFVSPAPVNQINISAQVNDLGITGLNAPVLVDSSNGTIYDNMFFGDPAVQVSLTGTSWGGAKYLDNFRFEGVKSADSCIIIPTALPEHENSAVLLYPNPVRSELTIKTVHANASEIIIYDALLRELMKRSFAGEANLNLEQLSAGTYFYELKSSASPARKGIILKE